MKHVGLFTKYAGAAAIGLGLGVTGMAGKTVYDAVRQECAYQRGTQILSSREDTPKSNAQEFVTGGGLVKISISDNASPEEDAREQRSQDMGAGIMIAFIGIFGMAMGYESHSRYYLDGRDPLNLLSDSPAL